MDEEKLHYVDTLGNVNIYRQGKAGTTTEKYISHLLSGKYKKYEETIEKLQKYTQHPVEVDIVLEIDSPVGDAKGTTKPVKHLLSRQIKHYNITIQADDMYVLTHEFCHVIDQIGTKNQLSKSPEFEPIMDLYQKERHILVNHIKQNNEMEETDRKQLLKYWNDPYRNGDVPTEIFARLCEQYLTKKEDILGTPKNKLDQFDKFCINLYTKYEKQIEAYFDNVLTSPNKDEELTETDVQAFKLNLELLDNGIELSR